ncbi:MAG: hypothetical protein J6R77_03595, partial [Clostridia bacterium]|nr:hypothetical protein [Clostridia bacterium]
VPSTMSIRMRVAAAARRFFSQASMRNTAFLFALCCPWAISVYQYTIHFAKRKVGKQKKFCRKIARKKTADFT